jgi:LCP family protein required for cell wall assembly
MSGTSVKGFFTRQAAKARGPEPERPPKRWQRLKRIAIAAGAGLVVAIAAVVGAGYLYVNNLASRVKRIPVAALTAADQPAATGSMNVLLTASGAVADVNVPTGLIELIHLNANHQGGAVISFPANVLVPVAGHGRMELGDTLAAGGPSLMIETLEHLTGVRIDHYSRITYSGLSNVVAAMGGVDVNVPYPTQSLGFPFHAGVNHLTGASALAYVRQPLVSEVGRMELQENLFRQILRKIARDRFFVGTDFSVLNAVVAAVSVDSSFTNSQLESLALSLGHLQGSDGISIDVPTSGSPQRGGDQPVALNRPLDRKLWRAIRDDSVALFALTDPLAVTPGAPA